LTDEILKISEFSIYLLSIKVDLYVTRAHLYVAIASSLLLNEIKIEMKNN